MNRTLRLSRILPAVLLIAACTEVPIQPFIKSEPADSASGEEGESDTAPEPGGTDTLEPSECTRELTQILRDFSYTHQDFGTYCCNRAPGLIEPQLGSDGKPVFASAFSPEGTDPAHRNLTDAAHFNQWFNTIDGINFETSETLQLESEGDTSWQYRNDTYFPLSPDFGFGDEYNENNFYFTMEMHLEFIYQTGRTLTVGADDDTWVFINKQLILDFGGVHPFTARTVNLDELAGPLGMVPGNRYALDIFHAERATGDSSLHIVTDIDCLLQVSSP